MVGYIVLLTTLFSCDFAVIVCWLLCGFVGWGGLMVVVNACLVVIQCVFAFSYLVGLWVLGDFVVC